MPATTARTKLNTRKMSTSIRQHNRKRVVLSVSNCSTVGSRRTVGARPTVGMISHGSAKVRTIGFVWLTVTYKT